MPNFFQNLLAKIRLIHEAADRFQQEGFDPKAEDWKTLARKLKPQPSKCDYCEAKDRCSALFVEPFVSKSSDRVVYDPQKASPQEQKLYDLHKKYLEISQELDRLYEEKKTVSKEMLPLLEGKTYVFPDTGRSFFVTGGWTTETLDVKKLPKEEVERLKKEHPEAVTVQKRDYYVSTRRVKAPDAQFSQRRLVPNVSPEA